MATSFIRISSGLNRLHDLLLDYETRGMQSNVEIILQQSLKVMTTSVRDYMPASHRLAKRNQRAQQKRLETSSGRLWSGWGLREVVIHDDEGRSKKNPTEAADNYHYIRRKGSGANLRFTLVTGTNIRYAKYVDEGRPLWHKGRPKYNFKRLGRGKALQKISSFAQAQLNESLSDLERRGKAQSFRASGQRRDPRGRFAKASLPGGTIASFIG